MNPLFFELMRWGDFDVPYTDSVWYKAEPTDTELTFHKNGILLNKMLIEFMKLSGCKVSKGETQFDSIPHARKQYIVCKAKADQSIPDVRETFEEFKNYLIARGYKQLETTKLHFTDGN